MAISKYLKDNQTLYQVYVQVLDPRTGLRRQTRRKGYTSLAAAKREEFLLKHELVKLNDAPLPTTWGKWHQYCMDLLRPQLSRATMLDYEGRIKKWVNPYWANRELKEISSNDCHELLYQRITELTMRSKREILKIMKRVFQMAVDEGLLLRNPASRIKIKVAENKQLVLNPTEVETLLREAKNCNHPFYEVWVAALLTGMRSGELYALKWSDVDLDSGKIFVTRSWSSKSGEGPTKSAQNRVVPISRDLLTFLKELRLRTEGKEDFVLPHPSDWSFGLQAQVLKEFCKAIGITAVKFHDLRATFITQLLLNGCSLAKVMAVVGHRHIKTTNIYLRMAGADLQGTTEMLSFKLPSLTEASVLTLRRN